AAKPPTAAITQAGPGTSRVRTAHATRAGSTRRRSSLASSSGSVGGRASWGTTPSATDGHERLELGQRPLPDAADLEQLVDAREPPVLVPPRQDVPRGHGPDA